MQNLIPLIFGALFVYLLFFRRGGGGMGCCGGHGSHEQRGHGEAHSGKSTPHPKAKETALREEVIDLREDEYTVLPSKDDKLVPSPSRRVGQDAKS